MPDTANLNKNPWLGKLNLLNGQVSNCSPDSVSLLIQSVALRPHQRSVFGQLMMDDVET